MVGPPKGSLVAQNVIRDPADVPGRKHYIPERQKAVGAPAREVGNRS